MIFTLLLLPNTVSSTSEIDHGNSFWICLASLSLIDAKKEPILDVKLYKAGKNKEFPILQ